MTRTMLATLLALAALVPASAQAQYYKGKTITMIVNYPPGGPTDIEGRIVAQHLPDHIPGHPTIVVKNIGGGSGLLGSNELGDATPDGLTIGFFTLDVMAELTDNPSVRTHFSDFVLLAGVESPLVAYIRKDTPPGINVPADLMKAKDFKALSLNAQNINSINQEISLDLLGLKYQPIPAYRGLKEVETAILQNTGQMANTSLSGWLGSAEPSMRDIVIPLWQLAPRGKDGSYPRSRSLPDMQTFEEFYASVTGGKTARRRFPLSGHARRVRPAAGDVPRRRDAAEIARRRGGGDAVGVRRAVAGPGFSRRLCQGAGDQADHGLGRGRPGNSGRSRQGAAPDQGLSRQLHQPRHREIAGEPGDQMAITASQAPRGAVALCRASTTFGSSHHNERANRS